MLQNAYFLAKIGADTAENEQHSATMTTTPEPTAEPPGPGGGGGVPAGAAPPPGPGRGGAVTSRRLVRCSEIQEHFVKYSTLVVLSLVDFANFCQYHRFPHIF